jgi:hypothetical protein
MFVLSDANQTYLKQKKLWDFANCCLAVFIRSIEGTFSINYVQLLGLEIMFPKLLIMAIAVDHDFPCFSGWKPCFSVDHKQFLADHLQAQSIFCLLLCFWYSCIFSWVFFTAIFRALASPYTVRLTDSSHLK